MNAEELLQEIQDRSDCKEFKAFSEKLALISKNREALHIDHVVLPNLIFLAAPGGGITMHLRLLTDLLKELRLLPFIGEEECFEWAIADADTGVENLIRRIRKAGGFYGQFRGVIGLDIGKLLWRTQNASGISADNKNDESIAYHPIDRLMEYVEAQQGRILFCFILPINTPESTVKRLLSHFASRTPAEIIELPFPKNTAQDYIADQLYMRGFTVAKEAVKLLQKAVDSLRKTSRFKGYQTLENLADEIIWRKLCNEEPKSATILQEDVSFIFAENGYLSHFSADDAKEERRRVGFGEGGNGTHV